MAIEHDQQIIIIYFSETGTAHSLAEDLRKKLLRLRFRTTVLAADNDVARIYRLLLTRQKTPDSPIVIFLCSTTGNGEFPRHARRLWRALLQRKLNNVSCGGIDFTSFGLGDSAYARFNWAAKKLHKRMLQLGATEVCTRGEGDESASGGTEAAYAAWADVLTVSLLERYPLPDDIQPIPKDVLLPPSLPVSILNEVVSGYDFKSVRESRVSASVRVGRVVENTRITAATHFQDTRSFKLEPDPSSDTAEFVAGATLAMYPQNDEANVSALLKSQKWDMIADNIISVPSEVEKWATTKPLTLRTLLTYHLDITAVPRATFFDTLSYFASDNEQQRTKLEEFGDAANEEFVQDRYDYADRPRRSAMECLIEFESVSVPVEYILEIFSELRPRQFSIAGYAPDRIELLVAIVKYQTILRRAREGVCTKYLANLQPKDSFLYEICPPQSAPPPIDKPAVLVGPGTGVAPLRALIQQRLAGQCMAETVLIFGSRSKVADFYYENEWCTPTCQQSTDANGVLTIQSTATTTVYACFSRDSNRLKYVQNVLSSTEIAARVADLLVNCGGYVWVCGSKGKMPRAVRSEIQEAVAATAGMDGADFVAELDRRGRYLEETW
ncbi:uncharacterized protein V2V93DRAFT_362702 [Kockiozyma suomiensis]|uniref:uncharacterized protein n=1 Tax=Kockiozyma suomiensis TaxID=1337062 RepID=UPI0033438841